MEKQKLQEFFERASKAAEKAAAKEVSDAEETRCLDALKALRGVQVTTSLLVETQVGRKLKKLAKHQSPKIAETAQGVIDLWRKLVAAENSSKKSSPAAKANSTKSTAKPLPDAASVKPKIVKTGDDARDKLAEIILEALLKVLGEVDPEVGQIAARRNISQVVADVERAMFAKFGLSTGANKVKIRSIIFNLKDANNPDLRRRVLLGEIKPDVIVNMTAEDMASDQRKMQNQEIKAKALFECERGLKQLASTDQFKCGKCGQRKTTYYQMQTRSADEPMTTFVTCVNCNNHWKFC